MRVLFSNEDHYKFLYECLEAKPNKVCIATYGLYAGIGSNGQRTKHRSEVNELLEAMRTTTNVRILVGNYEYKSCKGKTTPCNDCERGYVMTLIRHVNHAEAFPQFKWRISDASHLKCYLFSYPDGEVRGATGGRNLTDSSWEDVTVELDKMSTLRMFENFVGLWRKSKLLSSSRVNEVLADQGISERTMKRVLETL